MYRTCHEGLQLQTCKLLTSMQIPDVETGKRGFHLGSPAVGRTSALCLPPSFSTVFTRGRSSDRGTAGRKSAGLLQKALHVIYYRVSHQALNPRLGFESHPAAQLHWVCVTKASTMRKENHQLIRKLGNFHVLLPKKMPIKLNLCIILWKLFSKTVFAAYH